MKRGGRNPKKRLEAPTRQEVRERYESARKERDVDGADAKSGQANMTPIIGPEAFKRPRDDSDNAQSTDLRDKIPKLSKTIENEMADPSGMKSLVDPSYGDRSVVETFDYSHRIGEKVPAGGENDDLRSLIEQHRKTALGDKDSDSNNRDKHPTKGSVVYDSKFDSKIKGNQEHSDGKRNDPKDIKKTSSSKGVSDKYRGTKPTDDSLTKRTKGITASPSGYELGKPFFSTNYKGKTEEIDIAETLKELAYLRSIQTGDNALPKEEDDYFRKLNDLSKTNVDVDSLLFGNESAKNKMAEKTKSSTDLKQSESKWEKVIDIMVGTQSSKSEANKLSVDDASTYGPILPPKIPTPTKKVPSKERSSSTSEKKERSSSTSEKKEFKKAIRGAPRGRVYRGRGVRGRGRGGWRGRGTDGSFVRGRGRTRGYRGRGFMPTRGRHIFGDKSRSRRKSRSSSRSSSSSCSRSHRRSRSGSRSHGRSRTKRRHRSSSTSSYTSSSSSSSRSRSQSRKTSRRTKSRSSSKTRSTSKSQRRSGDGKKSKSRSSSRSRSKKRKDRSRSWSFDEVYTNEKNKGQGKGNTKESKEKSKQDNKLPPKGKRDVAKREDTKLGAELQEKVTAAKVQEKSSKEKPKSDSTVSPDVVALKELKGAAGSVFLPRTVSRTVGSISKGMQLKGRGQAIRSHPLFAAPEEPVEEPPQTITPEEYEKAMEQKQRFDQEVDNVFKAKPWPQEKTERGKWVQVWPEGAPAKEGNEVNTETGGDQDQTEGIIKKEAEDLSVTESKLDDDDKSKDEEKKERKGKRKKEKEEKREKKRKERKDKKEKKKKEKEPDGTSEPQAGEQGNLERVQGESYGEYVEAGQEYPQGTNEHYGEQQGRYDENVEFHPQQEDEYYYYYDTEGNIVGYEGPEGYVEGNPFQVQEFPAEENWHGGQDYVYEDVSQEGQSLDISEGIAEQPYQGTSEEVQYEYGTEGQEVYYTEEQYAGNDGQWEGYAAEQQWYGAVGDQPVEAEAYSDYQHPVAQEGQQYPSQVIEQVDPSQLDPNYQVLNPTAPVPIQESLPQPEEQLFAAPESATNLIAGLSSKANPGLIQEMASRGIGEQALMSFLGAQLKEFAKTQGLLQQEPPKNEPSPPRIPVDIVPPIPLREVPQKELPQQRKQLFDSRREESRSAEQKPLKSILKRGNPVPLKPPTQGNNSNNRPSTISEIPEAVPNTFVGQECIVRISESGPERFFCKLCQCHIESAIAKELHVKSMKHIELFVREKSSLLQSVIGNTPVESTAASDEKLKKEPSGAESRNSETENLRQEEDMEIDRSWEADDKDFGNQDYSQSKEKQDSYGSRDLPKESTEDRNRVLDYDRLRLRGWHRREGGSAHVQSEREVDQKNQDIHEDDHSYEKSTKSQESEPYAPPRRGNETSTHDNKREREEHGRSVYDERAQMVWGKSSDRRGKDEHHEYDRRQPYPSEDQQRYGEHLPRESDQSKHRRRGSEDRESDSSKRSVKSMSIDGSEHDYKAAQDLFEYGGQYPPREDERLSQSKEPDYRSQYHRDNPQMSETEAADRPLQKDSRETGRSYENTGTQAQRTRQPPHHYRQSSREGLPSKPMEQEKQRAGSIQEPPKQRTGPPQQRPGGPLQKRPGGPPQLRTGGLPQQRTEGPPQQRPGGPLQKRPGGPPQLRTGGLPQQRTEGPPQQRTGGPLQQRRGPPQQRPSPSQQRPGGPLQKKPGGPPQQKTEGPPQQRPGGPPQQRQDPSQERPGPPQQKQRLPYQRSGPPHKPQTDIPEQQMQANQARNEQDQPRQDRPSSADKKSQQSSSVASSNRPRQQSQERSKDKSASAGSRSDIKQPSASSHSPQDKTSHPSQQTKRPPESKARDKPSAQPLQRKPETKQNQTTTPETKKTGIETQVKNVAPTQSSSTHPSSQTDQPSAQPISTVTAGQSNIRGKRVPPPPPPYGEGSGPQSYGGGRGQPPRGRGGIGRGGIGRQLHRPPTQPVRPMGMAPSPSLLSTPPPMGVLPPPLDRGPPRDPYATPPSLGGHPPAMPFFGRGRAQQPYYGRGGPPPMRGSPQFAGRARGGRGYHGQRW